MTDKIVIFAFTREIKELGEFQDKVNQFLVNNVEEIKTVNFEEIEGKKFCIITYKEQN